MPTMKQLEKRMAALEKARRPNITIDGDYGTAKERLRVLGDLAVMGREIARGIHATGGPTVNIQAALECNNLTIGHGTAAFNDEPEKEED